MTKLYLAAFVVAVAVATAPARENTKMEKAGTQTELGSSQALTVDAYRSHMRDAYEAVGLSRKTIAELLPIDVKIYSAHNSGDTERVAKLQKRQRSLLSDDQTKEVEAYFREHPLNVRPTADRSFLVWQKSSKPEMKGGALGPPAAGGNTATESEMSEEPQHHQTQHRTVHHRSQESSERAEHSGGVMLGPRKEGPFNIYPLIPE